MKNGFLTGLGGDLGGALLEGGVDEAQVRVVVRLGVHSGTNQVLDCQLHSLQHIFSTSLRLRMASYCHRAHIAAISGELERSTALAGTTFLDPFKDPLRKANVSKCDDFYS